MNKQLHFHLEVIKNSLEMILEVKGESNVIKIRNK